MPVDLKMILKYFPVPLPTAPSIPHRYEGRIDGVNEAVKSVVAKPDLDGSLTVTINFQKGTVVQSTYHGFNNTPEVVKVNGQNVQGDEIHFIKGFSFSGGPWLGFKIMWEVSTASHRADVRAYVKVV